MKYQIGDSLRINIKGYSEDVAANVAEDGKVSAIGLYLIDPEKDGRPRYIAEEVLDAIVQMGADVYHLTEVHGDEDPEKEELVEIQNIIPGTTIEVGGIKMEILDSAYPAVESDELGVLCLAKDILFEKAFDEENNNNWRESSLREYLNGEYKDSLPEELKEALLPFERDLMANDGLKAYGKCTDDVSLISEREYQDYREHISDKSDWWWTLTAWSAKPGYSYYARSVYADGSLNSNNACSGHYGVSPAFLLLPSLKVRIVEEEES